MPIKSPNLKVKGPKSWSMRRLDLDGPVWASVLSPCMNNMNDHVKYEDDRTIFVHMDSDVYTYSLRQGGWLDLCPFSGKRR